MSNALINIPRSQIATAFGDMGAIDNDAYTANVGGGFAAIRYKGKVWRVKYKGEEIMVPDPNNKKHPAPFLDCVLLASQPELSKTFYLGKWTDGMSQMPDCFSVDGKVPDPSSPHLQSRTCGACEWQVWGSAITENGKRTRRCRDNRRVAIVPADDIENELYGGPMLLGVPPASLMALASYAMSLKAASIPVMAVVTRISFDVNCAHPQFVFDCVRAIDESDAPRVLEARLHPNVDRMFQEAPDLVAEDAPVPLDPVPAATASPKPQPRPTPTPPPQVPKPPAPQPAARAKAPVAPEPAETENPAGPFDGDEDEGTVADAVAEAEAQIGANGNGAALPARAAIPIDPASTRKTNDLLARVIAKDSSRR